MLRRPRSPRPPPPRRRARPARGPTVPRPPPDRRLPRHRPGRRAPMATRTIGRVMLYRASRLDIKPHASTTASSAANVVIATKCYPKVVPSAPDGVGSGRRIMRNELNSPDETGEERNEQCHLKRNGSCFGVDADDLVLDLWGLVDQQLCELSVGHQLRVLLQCPGRPVASPPAGARCWHLPGW